MTESDGTILDSCKALNPGGDNRALKLAAHV